MFTSKDDSIASVSSSGLIKGVKEGTSTITVASAVVPSLTQEVQVTVTAQ